MLQPHLVFNGDCKAALEFYEQCFPGGKIKFMATYEKSPNGAPPGMEGKILHSEFEYDDTILMAADCPPDLPAPAGGAPNVYVSAQFKSPDAIADTFAKLAAGGKTIMPLEKQFWNAIFGILTDKFGICWLLNCQLPEK